MSRWISTLALVLLFAVGMAIGATGGPQPLSASETCEEDVCDYAPGWLSWLLSDHCIPEPGVQSSCDMLSDKRCKTRPCDPAGGDDDEDEE